MLLRDASLAFTELFTPPFRAVLWKSIGLTIALLALLFIGAEAALSHFLTLPYAWLDTTLSIVAGLGLIVGLTFLIVPVTSLFAGLFLDEIAEVVERTAYPQDPPGRAMALGPSIFLSLKFFGVVILVNLLVLVLLLLPGINLVAFFLANGYLLGREYFEFAAMRFHSPTEARRLRRENGTAVFLAGLIVAGVLAVPILNLVAPLFATALMVRVYKRISGSRPLDEAKGAFSSPSTP